MNFEKATTKNTKRFDDACGTAHALEIFGDRWALLIIREMLLGPRRFFQLKQDLRGISTSVLTQRLNELEAYGVLVKNMLPPPASTQVYQLTSWGYEIEPITSAMGRWAARSPAHDPNRHISAVSLLLSFRTMLDRSKCKEIDADISFRFGDDTYTGHLSGDGLNIQTGSKPSAATIFAGEVKALGAAVYAGVPLEQLESEGTLSVEGDHGLAELFTTLFPMPPKFKKTLP